MGRRKKPNLDAEKLRNLLLALDKLRDAGFIKSHIFINDQHTIQFTDRGMALVKAMHDLEAALPKLSDGERSGLWQLFRMTELSESSKAQPASPPNRNLENLDHADAAPRLAEAISSQS